VTIETKGEERQDPKGDTQQRRRMATGVERLLPIQSHASFVPEAEIYEV